MKDDETTLNVVKQEVLQFVDERDWSQFHSPKNLTMALSIEAGELMEHFQWLSTEESRHPDAEKLEKIGEELADVFCYTLAIANELNLDLAAVFERKMNLNREKYPVQEFKGRFGADDPNPVAP